jgi:hypothetical protein
MFRALLALRRETLHVRCVFVVSPDDGQVMPETCRDFELQYSDSESKVYQMDCFYYVIMSLWCTSNRTLNTFQVMTINYGDHVSQFCIFQRHVSV